MVGLYQGAGVERWWGYIGAGGEWSDGGVISGRGGVISGWGGVISGWGGEWRDGWVISGAGRRGGGKLTDDLNACG